MEGKFRSSDLEYGLFGHTGVVYEVKPRGSPRKIERVPAGRVAPVRQKQAAVAAAAGADFVLLAGIGSVQACTFLAFVGYPPGARRLPTPPRASAQTPR